MAHINDCVPGTKARVVQSGVARVIGKTGLIVEMSRVKRGSDTAVRDSVTVDVPGHGEVVVGPGDLELEA